MTTFVFPNNVKTTLSAAVAPTDLTINVASSTNLPTLTTGQAFPITLLDNATKSVVEICYCTAVTGTQLTVTRGEEGTSALTWGVGDIAFSTPTGGTIPSEGLLDTRYVLSGSDQSGGADVHSSSGTLSYTASGKFVTLEGNTAMFASFVGASLTVTANVAATLTANGTDVFEFPDASTAATLTWATSEFKWYHLYCAAAGTWQVTGMSGRTVVADAVNNNEALPLGQSLTSGAINIVTTSRAVNTVYTNSSNRPMFVSISWVIAPGDDAALNVGGLVMARVKNDIGTGTDIEAPTVTLVPPGSTYEARAIFGTPTVEYWAEYN